METTRRSFLKAGALGALVLAAGGGIYRAVHTPRLERFVLDGEARAALRAIVPAMLGGALPAPRPSAGRPSAPRSRASRRRSRTCRWRCRRKCRTCSACSPWRRRGASLTGVSGGWENADPQQVGAFLQDWRLHRFALLRTAYGALHDLTLGAWYAEPASWNAIGYPGPMKELS